MATNIPQNQGMSEDTKTIIVVLLLIFVFPVGLILMWFWTKWPWWVKLLISLPLLIIIIAVVGIAAFTVNPSNSMRLARDATRLDDMANLSKIIEQVKIDNPKGLCGSSSIPCAEDSFPVKVSSTNVDGTGWIKTDLSKINSKITKLPLDPVNDEEFNYSYCSNGKDWEISIAFESEKFNERAKVDGGVDPNLYEIGTKLNLCD